MNTNSFWWRLVHLEPTVWRGSVVGVVALLGALGIIVAPDVPDALVTAWVGLAALVQAVWVRPSVTANARVAVEVPDPARPDVVAAGEAVTTASNTAIIGAARDVPRGS